MERGLGAKRDERWNRIGSLAWSNGGIDVLSGTLFLGGRIDANEVLTVLH